MGEDIEEALSSLLQEQGSVSSGELARRTGRTRQAIHRHLQRWLAEDRLVREGQGRSTRYRARARGLTFDRSYSTARLEEADVWLELRGWLMEAEAQETAEAVQVLQYVVTELVNNAIEHSDAPSVTLRAQLGAGRFEGAVIDGGIGALESLRARLGLEDHLHALQELSKGKATTAPERHTGEGLFFASKMVDRFELDANGYAWMIDRELDDQAIREVDPRPGTRVRFELALATRTTPEEIFNLYTHDFEFDTTRCVIRLFEHGVRFVSRSEAKRLVAGLERFRHVILDFAGVEGVGQGFVDEVFRVWARAHPDVSLVPVHMSPAVEFMIRRGLPAPSGGGESGVGGTPPR